MSNSQLNLEDFDYHLPQDLIAQHPARNRDESRMLVIDRETGRLIDDDFRNFPQYLQPDDLVVLNNSRVIPARLFGHRLGTSAQPIGKTNPARHEYLKSEIEVLLIRQLDPRTWEALVKPGRKVGIGERIIFHKSDVEIGPSEIPCPSLEAEVIGRGDFGLRTLRFPEGIALAEAIEALGHIPLPPYISRPDSADDRIRYQTVFAKQNGSVAAPTAGLHFTPEILEMIASRGVELAEITLHVGLGTFQPIHEDKIDLHRMHPEFYEIDPNAANRLNRENRGNRRLIAVGTTTVRTLEHVAAKNNGRIKAERGETELFIRPGFEFRVTGGLLTNFHLPRTTLLMLVCAFAGREITLAAYERAVRNRYRFYSYGDCMLIL
ncbi:MAG: tRNA preQ1(34) S-adenosylmethionine ribosyltransferase-isomerase QueA [Acidobacteria bacterium RIFCSPLOWO2_12_FULL_54_10]|nr:MAG: tRNA preQ1(34) S-adenosylmethionine ribosyltransferase-isomerase QueA [Acidobacteria bacterium RIFCSPLOWO2_12_FULL_54_10]